MRKRWPWLIVFVAVSWLQLAAQAAFPARAIAPDINLAATVVVGFLRGPSSGMAAGLALGLTSDVLTGRMVGLSALVLVAVGLAAGLVTRRVFRENLPVLALTAFLLGLLHTLLYWAGARAFGLGFPLLRSIWVIGLPVGLHTALLGGLGYAVTYRRFGLAAGGDDHV